MTLSGKTLTSTELSCAANAVTKRENALSNAVGTMNGTQMTALSTRAMALGNAWTISDGSARKAAINTAWNNWKTSMETAQKTLNTTRVTILSSFKSDMQTCKVDDSEMPMMESENVPMNR